MAPGAGGRPARRRGNKPHAHKRRRGGGGGRGSGVNGAGGGNGARTNNGERMSAGADWKNRRRNRPSRSGRSSAGARNAAINGRANRNRRKRANGRPDETKSSGLQPITVRSNGIMSTWKKPLGGLIRYYVHTRTHDKERPVDQREAEEEIDRMYYRSGCSMEDTKTKILQSLGVAVDAQGGWIEMAMAIEKDSQLGDIPIAKETNNTDDSMDVSNANGDESSGYKETADKKGIILKQVLRAGEGPVHSAEQWTNIVVPDWAVSKSYFFEFKNNSPLNLSCELFIDGHKVARNSPVLPNGVRSTIRPESRYYGRHQWILNAAKRVKLGTAHIDTPNDNVNAPIKPVTPRYNNLRPDYGGQRVSLEKYPDPSSLGWKFTGSVQESRVEFFEKRMNNGGLIKLDFYYTTGTVKTVIDHPTSGRNQLFRALVTSEQYIDILKNPRAHTGQGYRRQENRPANDNTNNHDEEKDEFDQFPVVGNQTGDTKDAEMKDGSGPEVSNVPVTYYAKDDNYDFKKQGHLNRRNQMSKLQQSNDYVEWKEANKKEYAVIHAKFYVSIPKRMYGRSPPNTAGGGFKQRSGKQIKQLPLPEQSAVMDIKAAENATLGTKYEAIGPPQKIVRSHVRMERINSLKDDKDWKGDPVFEKKVYYRAEKVVNGQGFNHFSDDEMSEDENEEVSQYSLLKEYKTEKIAQVEQYYSELSMFVPDPEEAEQRLRNVKNKIHLAESNTDVDDIVSLFYNDLTHRELVESTSMNCL